MTDDLREFQPSGDHPWDRRAAAHLLRRAGFAPDQVELETAASAGLHATADGLMHAETDSSRHDELDALGPSLAARNDIAVLRAWWLLRMRHTRRPLHARLALFWHDHFATSNAKVQDARMMLGQLRTFERLGQGRFEPLLLAVARDPAMIVWLDGNENVKGRPNENFARELLELFSLGLGQYGEPDIRDAARAFTGWQQRRGRFRFVPRLHDDGSKTVLGTTGPLGGEEVIAIVTAHPACARFLATRLLQEFLCPAPPVELVDGLAARLRETGLEIGDAVRTILLSRAMFDPAWYRARIKSPVELAVGMARSLDGRVPGPALADAVAQMGQRLFEPPSVKGWDGHRAWLNSATMLVRLNAALRLCDAGPDQLDLAAFRDRNGPDGDRELIEMLTLVTLDGDPPAAVRGQIDALGEANEQGPRAALRLLLTCPEYQMA